jgi:hypothetical protein
MEVGVASSGLKFMPNIMKIGHAVYVFENGHIQTLTKWRCHNSFSLLKYFLRQAIFYKATFYRDSSVGIATGYGLDDHGGREFESR